jgi:hypothetical protein
MRRNSATAAIMASSVSLWVFQPDCWLNPSRDPLLDPVLGLLLGLLLGREKSTIKPGNVPWFWLFCGADPINNPVNRLIERKYGPLSSTALPGFGGQEGAFGLN